MLPDGSDRICAILCESGEAGQVCIINVYLPCRGYKDSDDRFLDALDKLREIVIKYPVNAHIVLLGDLYASLHREKPLARDIKLQSCLEEFQITTGENYPTDFTYVHGNGKSIIDYVLQTDARVVKKVKVQAEYSENTSPHCPVAADIVHIPEITVKPVNNSNTVNQRKVNWKKANINQYQTSVSSRIRSSFSDQSSDINLKVEKVSYILLQASAQCAPKASRKHLRIKVTPDFHLTYSKNCG